MIKLYQFPPSFGLRNASPFCLKTETYLRMVGLEYETVDVPDPRKAPKGKLPYIDDGGTLVPDSHAIVVHLENKHGKKPDSHLSDRERAEAHAVRTMIEEHLYWATVYSRWMDESNWATTKKEFFQALPPVVRSLLPAIFRKQVGRDLRGHGIGRHSKSEVYALAGDDLRAMSAWLGDKPYMTGQSPVEVDASAYGLLAQILWTPSNPETRKHLARLANLEAFASRMRDRYFPGAQAPR